MRVLVTFAMPAEFAPWRRLRRFERRESCGISVYETSIGHGETQVAITGVGAQNAHRVVRALLACRPDACISSGLAGGLKPVHRAGRVLVAHSVRHQKHSVASDPELCRAAVALGAKSVDAFLTSDAIVIDTAGKSRLGVLADAVEMESHAILQEAALLGVPAVAIRAVSDVAGKNLPLDFNRTLGTGGRVRVPRVMAQLAKAPHRLPGLIALGWEARRAAGALARFLDRYLEFLFAQTGRQGELAEAMAR